MNTEKAIKMIDEYLLEPNSIHPEWVKCLQLCKQALVENEKLKAERDAMHKDVIMAEEYAMELKEIIEKNLHN